MLFMVKIDPFPFRETCAVVRELANAVEAEIDDFFTWEGNEDILAMGEFP